MESPWTPYRNRRNALLQGVGTNSKVVGRLNSFELVPTPCKRAFLLFRYGVHGDSIWGCLRSKLASLSARKVRGAGNERMHRHFFCSGEHFDRTASCDRTSDLPKPYCSGTRQLSKFRR